VPELGIAVTLGAGWMLCQLTIHVPDTSLAVDVMGKLLSSPKPPRDMTLRLNA
jgi:hypothetical protein